MTANTTTAADICTAFGKVGREITVDRAVRAASYIRSTGCVGHAIAQAENDQAHEAMGDLSAYVAALNEIADPKALMERLLREAESFERLEARARDEAANYFGVAKFRAKGGMTYEAGLSMGQAVAAEASADDYQAKADAKREQMVDLRFLTEQSAALAHVAMSRPVTTRTMGA